MSTFLYLGFQAGAQESDSAAARRALVETRLLADREPDKPEEVRAPVPTARFEAGLIIYAYDFSNERLVSFDAANPSTYLTNVPVTGLFGTGTNDTEYLAGIDFRPSNGVLYGIAKFSVGRGRVVAVNPVTGAVGGVHPSNTFPRVLDQFAGIEVNPAEDWIREVGDVGANRRASLTDGIAVNDQQLRYAAGDPNFGTSPTVVHTAYAYTGAGPGTLYGIDATLNTLVRIGDPGGNPSPDSGVITTIGSLGLNPTRFGAMDIPSGSNTAYAALFIDSVPTLVTINLATGAASVVGTIGDGTGVIDGLSIPTGPLVQPTPAPTATPTPTPPVTPSPTRTPFPSPTPTPPTRFLRVENTPAIAGQNVVQALTFGSIGAEKSISFSLSFDTTRLANPAVTLGLGAASGSTITTDTSQAASGRLGVTITSPIPYAVGTYTIALVSFRVQQSASFSAIPINLVDSPTPPGFFSASGASLPGNFQSGFLFNLQTAAGVEVSGRVVTADGRGIRNATVVITDGAGARRTATTGSFGYYRFDDVEAGGAYVISAASKRYSFSPRALNVTDTLTGIDFTAQ